MCLAAGLGEMTAWRRGKPETSKGLGGRKLSSVFFLFPTVLWVTGCLHLWQESNRIRQKWQGSIRAALEPKSEASSDDTWMPPEHSCLLLPPSGGGNSTGFLLLRTRLVMRGQRMSGGVVVGFGEWLNSYCNL